jgi:Fur family ferric uptake transcriptional regulator
MRRNAETGPKLRMTRQRRALLKAVQQATGHPTADDIYRIVRRWLPHISLGTVYRNLEILSRHGIVHKIELGSTQRRFDAKRPSHYHVRCLGCGRVEDVDIRPQARLERAARSATNYKITGHRLEFLGLCGRCGTTDEQVRKGAERGEAKQAGA